ncbi:MAG: hypothetical protein JNM56_16570 [Planctomycetia bacterium]|nr:hypothetical protein [Planctomycetia bacterium]
MSRNLLLGIGLVVCAVPLRAAEPADELRPALARALPLLAKGAAGHIEQKTCFACHNQALPLLALTAARPLGFEFKDEDLHKQLKFIDDFLGKNRENFLKGKGTGGQGDTAGYALFALDVGGWKPNDNTAAVTEYLLLHQKDLEHWRVTSNRPPSEASHFTTNYLAIRGLRKYGTPEQQERIENRIAQVRAWLVKTPAKDTEDRVFRLGALHAAGAERKEIEQAVEELRQKQRADGGWSQLETLDSDAYATGSALVVLHQAGGLAVTDAAYQKGTKFLLQTQKEDGSWQVKTRSRPFQTYYESGFPHGKDQFISSAASGWAATALTLACPPK